MRRTGRRLLVLGVAAGAALLAGAAAAQWMGRGPGGCGGMWAMFGANAVRPASAEPEAPAGAVELPGPGTAPPDRFVAVCGQCHAPPDPGRYRADQWPSVVDRMAGFMENMGRGELSKADRGSIERYLQDNARQ